MNCCSVAQEHGIPLIKVDSNMKLGEWAGLCKIDQEGKARKVVKCSAAVVGIIIIFAALLVCHRLYVKLLIFPDICRSATGVARDLRMMCCRTTSRPTSNLPPPIPTCSRGP